MSEKDVHHEVIVIERNQKHECGNCRHGVDSHAEGKVWCMIRSQFVDIDDHCARWQVE